MNYNGRIRFPENVANASPEDLPIATQINTLVVRFDDRQFPGNWLVDRDAVVIGIQERLITVHQPTNVYIRLRSAFITYRSSDVRDVVMSRLVLMGMLFSYRVQRVDHYQPARYSLPRDLRQQLQAEPMQISPPAHLQYPPPVAQQQMPVAWPNAAFLQFPPPAAVNCCKCRLNRCSCNTD